MILYSIIVFGVAIIMIVVGILVYCGKTELIHEYHQRRVKNKKAYGKAIGKALTGMSVPLIISGAAGFFTTSAIPGLILIIGLILSMIPLFLIQKKYNGGVF